MADVMEAPMGDRRGDSPLPPPPPPPLRRREVDSKERREERDDRLPLPPPLPTGRGDREREYRRRSSASPPPYRDRRHSPPRRSPSPVPFKRSRRDDGGYDRRRGGSRGGYGMEDRRYDYGGGHERGGRGGGGYGEERGRYGGRQSDWLDSGRGFGDGSNSGMTQREGLMSYKQFIQELEDDVLPAEAQHRYEEYKSEYITTQKRAYFEAHKEEDWLKDKYHPNNLLSVIERRNEQARAVAKEFLLDLQSGNLDLGPGLTASALNKSGHGSDFANSEDEADAGGNRRRHGRGPVKENDLLSSAPKAHPVSSESRRVQVDIEQAQALAHKLDNEKGIEDNVLTSSDRDKFEGDRSHGGSMGPIIIIRGLTTVKGLEGVELLDTLITYLWRIHGLDYYGTSETNEPKGLRHVRAESKTYDGSDKTGTEWEQKLDLFWRERLHGQDPLETMAAKEKIDAASAEILDPFVRKIRDEKYGWKYGCGAKGCTKLFHAAEFVHKHLKLKHPDLVMELTSKLREDLYFQNYMNDANAPGGTPVMQQPTLKDKAPRRRHILENRLRDERGNRREHDDDRYNRNENSDMQNNGRSEGGIQDDPMYDAYGEQGLGGAPPFPPDIPPPPPVLMPVPGAGPLGPFVPAPPEVAMRMLREQGGPPPFEVNGGSRGRKGRLGPQVGGPAPLVAMPAAFRHDPRCIRSYQDLDAPEDEVTVIDYRSL